MKKPIEAKRVAAAVCIITIVIVALPISAFGWDGCVFGSKGDIQGLEFYFTEGLDLYFLEGVPGYATPVNVYKAVVKGNGKEKSFITPFDQYIYQTKLVDGWGELKKGRIIAFGIDANGEAQRLVFKFNKARLFESFFITDEGVADDACEERIEPNVADYLETLEIYLEVKKAKLVGLPGVKFDIILRIVAGDIVDFEIVLPEGFPE